MKPEGSLPHLQEPVTSPNPQPNQSSPCPIPLLEDPFSRPTPSWRTTPIRLSATPYEIYSQLPSISRGRFSIRNLRTHHAVVTGTHSSKTSKLYKCLSNKKANKAFATQNVITVFKNSLSSNSIPIQINPRHTSVTLPDFRHVKLRNSVKL